MPRHTKKVVQSKTIDQPKLTVVFFGDKPKTKWTDSVADEGYSVQVVSDDEFLRFERASIPDTVLLYFNEKSAAAALQFTKESKRRNENLPIVCITSSLKMEDVVALMRAGAYDCVENNTPPQKLLIAVNHAVEMYQLTRRVSLLESQVQWEGKFDDLIGASSSMQEIFQMIKTVAKSNATVLLLGESGTGKELVAQSIHRHSKREQSKFIDINCGAIPKELLENELFGHERGAFTGADRRYIGSIERAHRGSLFLDEIGEMDTTLQVKLLRLLQERNLQRIGGTDKISVDIRVIAATNRDLRAEVEAGNFREELYYRLNVVPIHIPPLRNRREDVHLIAKYFLDRYAKENNRRFKDFMPDALEALVKYDWPGNVRELENTIERVVVLHDELKVKRSHLPLFIQKLEKNQKFRRKP